MGVPEKKAAHFCFVITFSNTNQGKPKRPCGPSGSGRLGRALAAAFSTGSHCPPWKPQAPPSPPSSDPIHQAQAHPPGWHFSFLLTCGDLGLENLVLYNSTKISADAQPCARCRRREKNYHRNQVRSHSSTIMIAHSTAGHHHCLI